MKFNITKLQSERILLESKIKTIKFELSKPHNRESSKLQEEKYKLKYLLTFIYSALAYSRNRIHRIGFDSQLQRNYLEKMIEISRSYLKYPSSSKWAWAHLFLLEETDNGKQESNSELQCLIVSTTS